MNYKAIMFQAFLLGLGLTFFGANADAGDGAVRGSYCNLDQMTYLLDIARYEGLTAEHVHTMWIDERIMLKSMLEDMVTEVQALVWRDEKEICMKVGSMVMGTAIATSLFTYFYYGIKALGNFNAYSVASRGAEFFEKKGLEEFKGYAVAMAEESWPSMWKSVGFAVGSYATAITAIIGYCQANNLFGQQEQLKRELSNLQSSLKMIESI